MEPINQENQEVSSDEVNQETDSETKKLKFNEVELSDGRIATVGRSRGRHIQNSMRMSKDHEERVMIISASVTVIDGNPLIYEDFLDMDSNDCLAIVGKYNEMMAGKSSSQPKSS